MRQLMVIAILLLGIGLAGCSAPSGEKKAGASTAKPAVKPSDFESGRTAYQRLYAAARNWAPDAMPVRMESRHWKENQEDGKSAIWIATFASRNRLTMRRFSWSGVSPEMENAPERGISAGSEDSFSPNNASTRPWDPAYLKTDSDDAFKLAQEKGGKQALKQDTELPIVYALTWDPTKSRLLWRVIYGRFENEAKLKVFVNATTGEFVRAEK